MTLTLSDLSTTTPVAQIKTAIQSHLGGPSTVHTDKIKIILNKKPIPSTKKTLADALADTDIPANNTLTLSVMVMGGAPDPPPQTTTQTLAAQQSSAPESEKAAAESIAADAGGMEGVLPSTAAPADTATSTADADADANADAELQTHEFWSDLQSFLTQRLKSEGHAEALRGTFERAWRSGAAAP